MADTKELTENEQRALEEYAASPGWYQYPGVDKNLRRDELLEMLDGDEFTEGPPTRPDSNDPDVIEEWRRQVDAYETEQQQPALAEQRERVKRARGEPNPPSPEPEKIEPVERSEKTAALTEPDNAPQSKVSVPELKFGSKHNGVRILKALLNLHALPCTPNGTFDGECERAVMEFQSDQRIPVTGVVDAKTWKALLDPRRPLG